jgi:glycerophosphoryl diester phosphodiesterase
LSVWTLPVLVVGHRGGRGTGWPPENTVAAFEKARVAGARAVELDVRTCASGQVVVFHDATLERMTVSGDKRRVSDVSFTELAKFDLGGGATIPALADVLEWARSCGVGVNVELKRDVPSRIDLLRETMNVFRAHPADVLWSSFDPMLLAGVAWLKVSSPRALLTESGLPVWALALERIVRPPLVSAIHLDAQQARASISGCLKRGLRVGVWTINDVDEAIALFDRGVRTVITDAPDRVLAALASRSQ